jgi:hypothetical protein
VPGRPVVRRRRQRAGRRLQPGLLLPGGHGDEHAVPLRGGYVRRRGRDEPHAAGRLHGVPRRQLLPRG